MKFFFIITILIISIYYCLTECEDPKKSELQLLFDKLSEKTQQETLKMFEYIQSQSNITTQDIKTYLEQNKADVLTALETDGKPLRKLVKAVCNKGKEFELADIVVSASCFFQDFKDEL